MILTSVLTMAFDTHEAFRIPSNNNKTTNYSHGNYKQILRDTTKPHPALYFSEFVITSLFAADLITRLIVCPSKVRFLKYYLNWLDILVVVSQWATVSITFIPKFSENKDLQSAYEFFSLVRICRVFLVVKLARHYTGLRILLLALKASLKEMLLLVIFMIIGMIIFATLIYYAEYELEDQFRDIPTGLWWAIVTMTTVGYGDVHPKSASGYVVGAMCALSGILATGLPIPIIANNFTFFYTVSKLKKMQDDRRDTLSAEVLDTVKSIFKVGENIVGKVTNTMSDVTSKVGNQLADAHRSKKKKVNSNQVEQGSTADGASNTCVKNLALQYSPFKAHQTSQSINSAMDEDGDNNKGDNKTNTDQRNENMSQQENVLNKPKCTFHVDDVYDDYVERF